MGGKVRVVTMAGVGRVWELGGKERRRRGGWGEKFMVKGGKIARQGMGKEKEKETVC